MEIIGSTRKFTGALIAILGFVFFTNTAFASVSYSRGGVEFPTNPITINSNVTSVSDLGGTVETYYCVDIQFSYSPDPELNSVTQKAGGFGIDHVNEFNIPVGTRAYVVTLYPDDHECDPYYWDVDGITVEGSWEEPLPLIFTVSESEIPETFHFSIISTTSSKDFLVGMTAGVANSGRSLWGVVAIIIALFVTFWVIFEVMKLFPKEEKKSGKSKKQKELENDMMQENMRIAEQIKTSEKRSKK